MTCKTVLCTENCQYFYVCVWLEPHPTGCDRLKDPWNVCMYVCMYVCTYVCICVCVCVCVYECVYACMYVSINVRSYVFMYMCVCTYVYLHELEYMTIYNRAHWIPSIPHILTIRLLGNKLSYHHLL